MRISFELVPVTRNSEYFQWFVKKHVDGILVLDPENKYLSAENLFFYVRNDEVAGLFAYNKNNDIAEIALDYVTIKFRDCKIGQYFLAKKFNAGITSFVTSADADSHKSYLHQIGFVRTESGIWEKKLVRE